MNKKLLSGYSLKYNPFTAQVPVEALCVTPAIDHFCWRVETQLVNEGGFALLSGDPGAGKSVTLRLLASRLATQRDVSVGVLSHATSNIADFYREMGDIFGVTLRPHNRWGGFKVLRERWVAHLEATHVHMVLIADEAQEMPPAVLNELRLLSSDQFDSRALLSVVLAGDARLNAKLAREDLLPLGSRIRIRLPLEPSDREALVRMLTHLVTEAGNASLMTPELVQTLAEHAMGNPRILCATAAELLAAAAHKEVSVLDEKFYLEHFSARPARRGRKAS
ncbi:MAG: ATP-binding protein [Granulosicoccus sp.]|nr:ATP-binding protein [Granulosicoccus sp.]